MAGRSEDATDWVEGIQAKLIKLMDAQIERLETTADLAEVLEVEKITKAYGTAARSAKAVATMAPAPKARAAAETADDDEAAMHDDIPDDPEELQAALAERFAHVADIIERKRRPALDGRGEAGSPAPAQCDAGDGSQAPEGPD